MGVSMKQLWFSSIVVASLGAACGTSKTTDQITAFADKVCKCKDVACATAVETEYLAWWKDNQRARGSEGDRKDVEKAMERYATCHNQLVGPAPVAPATAVPKVDLQPAPVPAPSDPAGAEIAPEAAETEPEGASEAAQDQPPTP